MMEDTKESAEQWERDRGDVLGKPTDGSGCRDCGCWMLFSARTRGTGLCHACAHARYAEIRPQGRPNWAFYYASLIMMLPLAPIVFAIYCWERRPLDFFRDGKKQHETFVKIFL